ncbi:TPA: PD-(D/E)XK nuclease-like domain-containing protein [Salmonella enterica]
MSENKEDFVLHCLVKNEEARKRLGIKAGFFWTTAKKLSVAVSRCIAAMDDKGYDEDDFKKPVRVNFPVVNDLPPEGVFDTEFCNRYEKGGDDGITMMQIPGAVPADQFHEKPVETPYTSTADNTDTEAGDNVTGDTAPLPAYAYNVNGELMADIEKEMSQPVSGLALPLRYLAQCSTDSVQHQITPERLKELHSLEMDPDSHTGSILLAIQNRKAQLEKLDTKNLHSLASYIGKVFSKDKQPQLNDLINFIDAVVSTEHIDRGLLVKEWAKGNRISRIETATKSEQGTSAQSPEPKMQKTPAAEAVQTARPCRSEKPTFRTINYEIGCGLYDGDLDLQNLRPALDFAKRVIAENREDWRQWSITAGIIPNIKNYDRQSIIDMLRKAPKVVHNGSPELRRTWCESFLAVHGVIDPDWYEYVPDGTSATHEENVEKIRQAGKCLRDIEAGRFQCDEKKPQPSELADEPATPEAVEQGTTEHHPNPQPLDAQSSVESDKTSREQFSEQLAADRGDFVPGISDPDDPKWVRDDYSASNEGEKTEVAADDAADTADYVDHSEEFSSQPEPETSHSEPVADQNEPETPETEPEPQSHVPDDIQPGIYFGVTNEAYHAGPGVSKSQLDDIAVCPAFYQWRKSAPVDTEKTKALDMGTALHCRLLEPDEFKKRFIIAPEFNRRTTAGKEEEKAFLESCENSGKTVMTSEEGRKLELMYGSVMAHPGCRALLEAEGKTESSIYWTDTETGELCRIRPDKFLTNSPLILDVKKVADMSRFARHVEEFRYHVQAAMYCEGWKAYSGETPRFAFLAVSESIDCGKYPVHLYILEDEHHDIGYSLFRRDLNTYHKCKSSNKWGWGFEIIERPYWARG